MEISFKTKEHPEARVVNYDVPESLEAAVAKFGEDAVFSGWKGALVISLQALARRHIEKSDAEIQDIVAAYDPNTRAAPVKQNPVERASSALSKLSPEERQALLDRLLAAQ